MQLTKPGSLNYKLIAQINKSINHSEKENILGTEQSKKALFTKQGFESGLERQLGFRWSDSRSKGKDMGRGELHWVPLAEMEDLFGAIVSLGENRFETDFKWSREQG